MESHCPHPTNVQNYKINDRGHVVEKVRKKVKVRRRKERKTANPLHYETPTSVSSTSDDDKVCGRKPPAAMNESMTYLNSCASEMLARSRERMPSVRSTYQQRDTLMCNEDKQMYPTRMSAVTKCATISRLSTQTNDPLNTFLQKHTNNACMKTSGKKEIWRARLKYLSKTPYDDLAPEQKKEYMMYKHRIDGNEWERKSALTERILLPDLNMNETCYRLPRTSFSTPKYSLHSLPVEYPEEKQVCHIPSENLVPSVCSFRVHTPMQSFHQFCSSQSRMNQESRKGLAHNNQKSTTSVRNVLRSKDGDLVFVSAPSNPSIKVINSLPSATASLGQGSSISGNQSQMNSQHNVAASQLSRQESQQKADLPQVSRQSSKQKADLPQVSRQSSQQKADLPQVIRQSSQQKADSPQVIRQSSQQKADSPQVSRQSSQQKADLPPISRQSSQQKADLPQVSRQSSQQKADLPPVSRRSSQQKAESPLVKSSKLEKPSQMSNAKKSSQSVGPKKGAEGSKASVSSKGSSKGSVEKTK